MLKSRSKQILLALTLLVLNNACRGDQDEGGETLTDVQLENLPLPSVDADQGIHPSKSVLGDVNNPFKYAVAGEVQKWPITTWADQAPAARAAAKFYYWATILAQGPDGVRQMYVANTLVELSNRTDLSDEQKAKYKAAAIRAYQVVLDEFPEARDYNDAGDSWLINSIAYQKIVELGAKPQGDWVVLPGWNGGIIIMPAK